MESMLEADASRIRTEDDSYWWSAPLSNDGARVGSSNLRPKASPHPFAQSAPTMVQSGVQHHQERRAPQARKPDRQFKQQLDRAMFMDLLHNDNPSSSSSQREGFPAAPIEVILAGSSEYRKGRAMKRKEQNKKSQQIYRARKEQYRHTLTADIESATAILQVLRSDNSMLLRALCDALAENIGLRRSSFRDSRRSLVPIVDRSTERSRLAGANLTMANAVCTSTHLSREAIEYLRPFFRAFLNLLSSHLGHTADHSDFAVALERLQTMVSQVGTGYAGDASVED